MLELKRELLDRDRHAQHAAGRARVGHDGVLHRRARTTRANRIGALVEYDADREDLHEPGRRAHRGVRHRQVRLDVAGLGPPRIHFQEELARLEEQALGALDLVVDARSTARSRRSQHQDVELAAIVIADDDRIDGRYLEVHQGILSLLALQAPVAERPAARRRAAARHQARRADGRPVREHRQAHPAHRPRAAGRERDPRARRADGRAARAPRSCRPSRPSPLRDVGAGRGPRAPGRRDQPAQPRVLPAARSRSATTRTRASGR